MAGRFCDVCRQFFRKGESHDCVPAEIDFGRSPAPQEPGVEEPLEALIERTVRAALGKVNPATLADDPHAINGLVNARANLMRSNGKGGGGSHEDLDAWLKNDLEGDPVLVRTDVHGPQGVDFDEGAAAGSGEEDGAQAGAGARPSGFVSHSRRAAAPGAGGDGA